MWSSETMCPSVQAMSVNEWPEPIALTGRPASAALVTARISSRSSRGDSMRVGVQT
jgi:hypothetical protein